MKEDAVNQFISKGFLVSPSLAYKIEDGESNRILESLELRINGNERPIVVGDDLLPFIESKLNNNLDINWLEFDSSKALFEKGKNGNAYKRFLEVIRYSLVVNDIEKTRRIELKKIDNKDEVIITKSYDGPAKKRTVQDFATYFRLRYEGLKKILLNRIELQNASSINRIMTKNGSEKSAIIALVSEKKITKNGNIIFSVEDLSGNINVIVTKGNGLWEDAKDLVEDEVVGFVGYMRDKALFANAIVWPDIPAKELKKAEDEFYAAFISDIHVGSKKFLYDEFMSFVKWLNGETNDEKQNELGLKVRYLFVIGDVIDGCGVFPGQEDTLAIKDIELQYKACAEILRQIRKDVRIIICPGQHDSLRLSEPQPSLYKDFARELWEMDNIVMVSNPAYVNINSSEKFPGFDVLMYHGASFHHFIANVDSLRQANPTNNPSVVSKFLLKRRHLAPTYGATGIIPDIKEDPLIIDKVPDFFVTGDMHRTDVSSYNGITVINSSCWQDKTEFEEKIGNNPDPGKVPIVNLKTREVKVLDFSLK